MYQIKYLDQRFKDGTWARPSYATSGSAGLDLVAALPVGEVLTLQPNQSVLVSTGIAIWLDDRAKVGLILPKSGKGSKGLVIGNLVGLIDSDYQGELKVSLWNRTDEPIVINSGEAVAQYVVTTAFRIGFHEVSEFTNATIRGDGGFGSTGEAVDQSLIEHPNVAPSARPSYIGGVQKPEARDTFAAKGEPNLDVVEEFEPDPQVVGMSDAAHKKFIQDTLKDEAKGIDPDFLGGHAPHPAPVLKFNPND